MMFLNDRTYIKDTKDIKIKKQDFCIMPFAKDNTKKNKKRYIVK